MWKWFSLLLLLIIWATWAYISGLDDENEPQAEKAVVAAPSENSSESQQLSAGDDRAVPDFTVTVIRPKPSSGY